MQANQIVELRALQSLREIYEESEVIKVNLKIPKYVCLISKLDGYKNPYFFDSELECWEGRDCTISGKFKFSASEGIQVIKESICLNPKTESIMVFITKNPGDYNNKENNLGIKLLERQYKMLKSSINFFEKSEINEYYEYPLSPTNRNINNSLNLKTSWKAIKIFWFEECSLVGKEGIYLALGVEMPLRRSLSSLMISGNYNDLNSLNDTKLNHIIGLINLVIKYISVIRNVFCNTSYLPIFLSTDSILLDIEKSIEESILNISEITLTDIGEKSYLEVTKYSTYGHLDCLYPILNVYKNNKYLSPEIAISYFIECSLKKNRESSNMEIGKIKTIYDNFDSRILKNALNQRILNKWQPLIFSGDIMFYDKNNNVQNVFNNQDNITDMIIQKEINLIVRIGMPSVVFSLGLLISKIFGGKDLVVSCDNDTLHSIDCLCEWNSCGDFVPFIGRVKEDNVMNSLSGRRNQSVEDILPELDLKIGLNPQTLQLKNKIHKLLWGCLNFTPSQRLTLAQVEYELRRISDDFAFIYHQRINKFEIKSTGRVNWFNKLKVNFKKSALSRSSENNIDIN
ncbi:uncharacterized protein cubi_00501 [Cryptosporidium ubiquitum]|uniref:Protein kinase domain-containing protein n=1 Tax=Cryptosporidium ubiquitum TaxID=857276 RepID=A0A1J4ME36_9CRYT|nr:uncharacterized protein cubi_00501 [Cryptosporidium ubiquitum]OII72506.1 hypothetical protein cubi_00501 [Cryptosporidium ubiquitum]